MWHRVSLYSRITGSSWCLCYCCCLLLLSLSKYHVHPAAYVTNYMFHESLITTSVSSRFRFGFNIIAFFLL
ncbi:hypothetical protein BRADI_4g37075v3 [Brachypodium distachyon]|uniref:Uncharacterized protein n=1 Tax=Brachypodium distachyon TaxID=15368 RepID=A0A2K2CSS4_BRADI|nr:hypothetical protein BRADI_4g37075v3 [Brachypodium distachyon]